MERITLFQFMLNGGYNQIAPVALAPKTGYKFVTLISSQDAGNATWIFFGKDASASFEKGDDVDPHKTFVVMDDRGVFKLTNKSGDAQTTLEARGYKTIEGITASTATTTGNSGLKALVGVSKEVRQLGMEIANADTDPQEYCDDVIKNGTFTDAEVKYLQSKVPALAGV